MPERPTDEIRSLLDHRKIPWTYLILAVACLLIQFMGSGRAALIYDRAAISDGQLWRIWTGHLVHFGWAHCAVDTGLFLLIGRFLEVGYPRVARFALLALPVVISGGIFFWAPDMQRYAGLSGLNVGLLIFLACEGWRRDRREWFWPAVLILHAVELLLESTLRDGTGGGMVQFDEPGIQVATVAHVAGALGGLILWLSVYRRCRPSAVEA